VDNELPQRESRVQKTAMSKHRQKLLLANDRRKKQSDSFNRQMRDWNDPELLAKNENEVMKDPYKTVFIARLDYTLTELDISQYFRKYGVIDSILIIRDHNGRSRGYGFIVFEREADAQACISELSRTGVKMKERTILVDVERSRVWRNWKPRRLGGGLGGRDYVKEGRVASAAASGRRIHIANSSTLHYKSDNSHKLGSHPHYNVTTHTRPIAMPPPAKYEPISAPKPYSYTSGQTSSGRSIRSIRGGE